MTLYVKITADEDTTIYDLAVKWGISDLESFDWPFRLDVPEGKVFSIPIEYFQVQDIMHPEISQPTPVVHEVIITMPPSETLWASDPDDINQYMWESAGNTGKYDQSVVAMAIQDAGTQWLNNAITLFNFNDREISSQMLQDAKALFGDGLSPEEQMQAVSQLISYDFDALSQAFSEYQAIFPELVHSEIDFHQYMMLHEHWRLTDQGLESPYTPMFQSDYGTGTLMYNATLDSSMQDMTEEDRESYLVHLLALAQEGEQLEIYKDEFGHPPLSLEDLDVSYVDLTAQIYTDVESIYGSDYTPADVAQHVNNLTSGMLNGDPLPYPLQDFVDKAHTASQAYIEGNTIDQARAIVFSWDENHSNGLLKGFEATISNFDKLENPIFNISHDHVKTAFQAVLMELQAQYNMMLNFKNSDVFSQELELYGLNEQTDEQVQRDNEILWTAFAIVAGTVAEPLDWGLALIESLHTQDPTPLAYSILPGSFGMWMGFRYVDDIPWGYTDNMWRNLAMDVDMLWGTSEGVLGREAVYSILRQDNIDPEEFYRAINAYGFTDSDNIKKAQTTSRGLWESIGEADTYDQYLEWANTIEDGLDSLPNYQGDIYRGLFGEQSLRGIRNPDGAIIVGNTYRFDSITSFTRDINQHVIQDASVVYVIRDSRSSVAIENVLLNPQQRELLLPSDGASYLIVAIESDLDAASQFGETKILIILEEIE